MAILRRNDRTDSPVAQSQASWPDDLAASPAAVDPVALVPRKPIGEILVAHGHLTEAQLETALRAQGEVASQTRRRLGDLLVVTGVVRPRSVADALGEQFGLEVIDPLRSRADPAVVVRLERGHADQLDALAMRFVGGTVLVVVGDPTVPGLVASLSQALAAPVRLAVGVPSVVAQARAGAYAQAEQLGHLIRAFEARNQSAQGDGPDLSVDESAPVVKVVTRIIEQAVADRASDVHIEPLADRVRVRNRIDGALSESLSLPSSMAAALASRIKIMAGLNIVERRRPQDGQIETTAAGRQLDIRVSTSGTVFGETVVLRILDRERALYGLAELGMPPTVEQRYSDVISSPYGLVVCAGPTGSGKTTTLYTTLQQVKSDEINVMTVEDPVEYVFSDINQIAINEAVGVDFASGLRAILRQDPDTILVGEIRDVETARIAIQAALTGHFVLTTIHATDAASAVHRFLDMGIETYLLASSLLATIGQRLVRRTCPNCIDHYEPSSEELAFYRRAGGDLNEAVFKAGAGCNDCSGTGYLGRVGVYEVMRTTDTLRDQILERAQSDAIRQAAAADGMVPMQTQAIGLIDQGVTTISEVMRTVYVV